MSVIGVPIINGVSYAHADIVLNLFGSPVIGITQISYGDSQNMALNFSTGNKATSVGFGIYTPQASLTFTLESLQAIINAAAANGYKLQNIPFFNVGINMLPESGNLLRHSLKKCRFMGIDLSSSVNNTQIEVSVPLLVADIDYHAL